MQYQTAGDLIAQAVVEMLNAHEAAEQAITVATPTEEPKPVTVAVKAEPPALVPTRSTLFDRSKYH